MEYNELIRDYTKENENKFSNIEKCPKCGEIGLKSIGSKSIIYVHKMYSTLDLDNPNVTEGCRIFI